MKKWFLVVFAFLFIQMGVSAADNGGLVAIKSDEGVFLSWQMSQGDYTLYRGDEAIYNGSLTNYTDNDGSINDTYRINDLESVSVWDKGYFEIPISAPISEDENVTYSANDMCIGDLDGDGEYDFVLKWDPSNSKDASQNGMTGKVYIDGYKMDGTRLWRIDMGQNIRAGAHDTQMIVYDFDNDGKCEIALRTADGTRDGLGKVIGDENALWAEEWSGRNLTGPLFITVFDGADGHAIESVPYDPQSNEPSTTIFGDGYGNRSERYNACVAYLDGKRPYMVFQRGYYSGRPQDGPGRTVIASYTFDGEKITKEQRFDTLDEANSQYIGQGNHNISVGDVDNDGKDEIFLGSLTLDDDLSVLWCSFMGHGDAMHLGDFDPDHEGLEFFEVHEGETANQKYGFTIFDAATGEILQYREAGKDTGRGMIANIGPFGGNYVAWAGAGSGMINSVGESLSLGVNSMNFRIYWDGDLYDELLDGAYIFKVTNDGKQEVIFDGTAFGCASNNGSKSNPCLQADFLGDWREEVILRSEDSTCLRIFSTTIPTEFAIAPLMQDHIYEMGTVWQNSSYNQPPHISYYLGGIAKMTVGSTSASVNGKEYTLDTPPIISNERTLVPVRFVAEAMGAKVEYAHGVITITKGDDVIVMVVGETEYTINSVPETMDIAPQIINDRTLVPVRFVADALKMSVSWDGETKSVTVTRGEKTMENVNIFIAGDSTAQSYGEHMAPQAGWGQMLPLFFDDSVKVVNRAMAGRSLKSFFNEGRWQSILDEAKSGDYVIIQFGQNEGAWNKPERYISHEDFAVMLEDEYIKPALQKGLNVIIATQTQSHWFDEETGQIYPPSGETSYATLLCDAAKKYNLPLIDVLTQSREMENKLGMEASTRLHLYAEKGQFDKYPDGVADNTHFSRYGAFMIADIVSEGLYNIEDLAKRKVDGFSTIVNLSGETTIDVRQWGFTDEFCVSISGERAYVNNELVLPQKGEVTLRVKAEDYINISSENAIAEVSPVWRFAPADGIDTSKEEYFIDIPDGEYDFTFIKSDKERGSIFINSLLVGANVDMYGTVGVPSGTRYTFDGFKVENGARIRVSEKTNRLKSVEVVKTPSIFERKVHIYVAGDSTLCNYYPVIPTETDENIAAGTVRTGWGQVLDRYLADYDVVNLASSGDWANNWKNTTFPTILANAKKGDYIVIQFGINDRNRDDKTKETMTTALKYMIDEAKKIGVTPILVKPQPSVGYSWGSAGEFEKPNGNNGGFFTAVTEVGEETGCIYIDLFDAAAEKFAAVGRDYVSRNYQLWDYANDTMADKLHISYDGARLMASLFAEASPFETCEYMAHTMANDKVHILQNSDTAKIINTSDENAYVNIGEEAVLITVGETLTIDCDKAISLN